MDDAVNQLVEQLNDAGDRLAHPPASLEELLNLLDEVELLLGKVDQSAPPVVQQALLPAMKALVGDKLFHNPDMDVKITVAACLNEIMRLTAPDAPYNDERMKEIFELIVASFDKLSLVSGRSYTKAVSIIDNVSKVKSCVMMLDLECDALIIRMFEQFQKNIRSDHPEAVFLAMESIMTLVIDESEDISLEFLRAILSFVRKENQNSSLMSWKLGSEVIQNSAEKLKPYLVAAINSMDISTDDYGTVVTSIWEHPSHASEHNHADDSGEKLVTEHTAANATSAEVVQSGNEQKHVLSPESKKFEQLATTKNKHPKSLATSKHAEKPRSPDFKIKAEKEMGSNKIPDKKSNKRNSLNPDEGHGKPSVSKGKGQLFVSSQAIPRKTSAVFNTPGTTPASGDLVPKEELNDQEDKEVPPVDLHPHSDGMKKRAKRKELSEGSGEKGVTSKSKGRSYKNNENQEDNTAEKVSRRKQNLVLDEVFETPHGKKYYKEDLIGSRVKVWWPKDKTYYEGVVAEFFPSKMKHKIEYDDGDEEILNLRKEIWELIGNDDEETDDQAALPLPNLPRLTPQRGTTDKGLVPDSGSKSNDVPRDGSEPRADATERSREAERSEAKRRRLVKGQKS
ncbi:hypothetical protein Dimus_004461 [Dionaea muscipula]